MAASKSLEVASHMQCTSHGKSRTSSHCRRSSTRSLCDYTQKALKRSSYDVRMKVSGIVHSAKGPSIMRYHFVCWRELALLRHDMIPSHSRTDESLIRAIETSPLY